MRHTKITFLLTPLREGRRKSTLCCRWRLFHFYSRPCGRGDSHSCMGWRNKKYFYSRPCGRGDRHSHAMLDGEIVISTHAPAGGATVVHGEWLRADDISTHAPAGGATIACATPVRCVRFLLTPLREGRLQHQIAFIQLPGISTHAPAGGATPARGEFLRRRAHFYSRPCGRGDCNFPQVRHEVLRQIAER